MQLWKYFSTQVEISQIQQDLSLGQMGHLFFPYQSLWFKSCVQFFTINQINAKLMQLLGNTW